MNPSTDNPKILFVHNILQPFVQIDRELLRKRWEVVERYEKRRLINIISLINQVRRTDLVFCWFASWHSLFPTLLGRLFNKPVVVVVGGYDTANVPAADYGLQRGGVRQLVARTILRLATHILTISNNAEKDAVQNANVDTAKITTIYCGLETPPLSISDQRDQLILTVGGVRQGNLLRKGLLPFVQTAALLPDYRFVLVGKWYDDSVEELKRIAGSNVEFTGFLLDEEVQKLYASAAVYVQPSLHEGFGMSVAEAMLQGCIPVVTKVGSLPEVVGDTGVFAASNKPEDIAAAIEHALILDQAARLKCRQQIAQNYTLDRRQAALHELIAEALAD